MKKLFACLGLLWTVTASAQFTPGQLLTAAELNNQFALYSKLAGAAFTGPVSASAITGTPISGSSGSFTTLSASSTLTLPAGSLSLSNLATQAANTMVANATGSTASPTAVAVPSCSTSSSALNWTTSGGASALTCNTSINAATLGGATFASPGSIGSGTPGSGAFTTLSSTGTFTPSQTNGIVGTTTSNNANAGSVGEYICAQVTNGGSPTGCVTNSSTPVTLSTATAANITSINLTAGDWDVSGMVLINGSTVNLSTALGGSTTVSATTPPFGNYFQYSSSSSLDNTVGEAIPTVRYSLGSTTTVYLIGYGAFATGTATAIGFIRARRIR